jgi:predicted nucleic acid binding AN1-type Zn finger protein
MSDSADLLGIGEHCAEPSCRLVDFLPFTCDCCHRTYCLEHRTYASHACKAAGQKQSTTIVCPLCAKAIKLGSNDDVMVVFDR